MLLGRFELLEPVVAAGLLEDVDRGLGGLAHRPECRLRLPWQACRSGRCATRRELKRFVKVPFRLHRDHPQWVAPLIFERMEFLDRKKNPYFEHAEAEYFLAERDGEPVGRISAQVDQPLGRVPGRQRRDVRLLRDRARTRRSPRRCSTPPTEWAARARAASRMLGPMDFTTNDEIGILIEGYERRPMILEPWHPPYYQRADRGRGLRARRWTC